MCTRALCVLLLILGLAGVSSAGLIVYDGFDYPAGSLGTRQGGTGWDAGVAWDGGQTVTVPGLEYPGLPVVGNKVATNSSNSFRRMPAGFSAANRTIWISFLCENSASPSWSGISPFNGSSEALFIGKPSGATNWGIALYNAQGDAGAATGTRGSTIPIAEKVFFVVCIVNGASNARISAWLNPNLDREPGVETAFYDSVRAGQTVGRVLFDRVRIAGAGAVFYDELRIGDTYADVVAAKSAGLASEPSPPHEQDDVPIDAALTWAAGSFAGTHDVYLGTAFADVNTATRTNPKNILVSRGQTATTFASPELFAYGQTYYWRVDEVNRTPDNTIFKGHVWSFTVEPYAYPVKPVAATASSFQTGMGPEKTIDGSGMTGDLHGTEPTSMWLSAGVQPNWIQYEFDKAYKLHELHVWNSNQLIESFLGFGAKTVRIETSTDGATWTALADVPQFTRAPGAAAYAANTVVNLGGVQAKYVKLTINTSWGGVAPQTGLSEVRFSYVPVQARLPQPATGATGVSIDTVLDWRPGREATSHKVFFGPDRAAVAAGTAPAKTLAQHGFDPGELNFGRTYYWKVDEVGGTGTYPGEVWSFTTQEYAVVENFESYTDTEGNRIYETWIDGWENKTGSVVGYLQAPFAERTIIHGGKQAMPLEYNNVKTPYYSETERTFTPVQDWTGHGADTLSLWFRGRAPGFVETAAGTILMGAGGVDIWGTADQFRFAFKTLNGNGSITARVDSLVNTNAWAKAGVMIRETLAAGSKHAFMALTPENSCSAQRRETTNATSLSTNWSGTAVTAPYWVRLTRTGDVFKYESSPDGKTWTALGADVTIAMMANVYVGLALTSHDAGLLTTAQFSNVSTTGTVTGSWTAAEIGVAQPSNGIGQLYLVVQDSTGKSKVVAHPNPAATTLASWQQWQIPLSEFTAAGVNLARVKTLTIGVGDRTSPKPGGAGLLYIDDIGFGRPAVK